MLHCMACDAVMPVGYLDRDNEHLNDLCDTCITKRARAERMEQHEFDGLWSDEHWIQLGGTPDAIQIETKENLG